MVYTYDVHLGGSSYFLMYGTLHTERGYLHIMNGITTSAVLTSASKQQTILEYVWKLVTRANEITK